MNARFLAALTFGVAILPAGSACTSGTAGADPDIAEAAIESGCVIESPIASDGYTSFADVDAARVTRKVMSPNGPVEDPMKVASPTTGQLAATMTKINKYVSQVNRVSGGNRRVERYSGSHRGEAMAPYCLFHKADAAVYGTVVLFHGFNDRPHQQGKLASYLFHAGFNVYNVFLANHYLVQGKDFWPKTTYRPEVLQTIQGKLTDPANQVRLAPVLAQLQAGGGAGLTPEQIAVVDDVLKPELSYGALQAAWQAPGGDAYKTFFNWHEPEDGESVEEAARRSDFFQYVRDANARLDDLSAMPGPLFVGGLSVGGALALAVAEADDTHRIHGVMAHAPWLRSVDPETTTQISLVGPLDENVAAVGGQYPIRWENHDIAMSPANIAANLALGAWTGQPSNVRKLALVPTAMITTEAEDSADNTATYAGLDADGRPKGLLQAALTSNPVVASLHVAASYAADQNVGHALTDPENYRDGSPRSWNKHWRSLYQESYRFYLTGTLDEGNLRGSGTDGALPDVPCVTPDFSERCR